MNDIKESMCIKFSQNLERRPQKRMKCASMHLEKKLSTAPPSEWFIQLEKESTSLKDESCLVQHHCKQRKPLFCVFDNTDSDSQFGCSEISEGWGLKETA